MPRKEKEKIKTVERCVYLRANGKYRVHISNGRSKRLNVGTFGSLDEAIKARDEAEKERNKTRVDGRIKRWESNLEKYKKDLIGKKVGKLTIIDVYRNKNDYNGGASTFRLLCKCDCGNETRPLVHQVIGPSASTFSCGCDRKKRGEKMLDSYLFAGTRVTNLQMKTKNATGVKGVSIRPNGRYVAKIWFQGKDIHLGTFDTLEEAAQARKEAEDKYFKPVIEAFNEQAMYKVEIKGDKDDDQQ